MYPHIVHKQHPLSAAQRQIGAVGIVAGSNNNTRYSMNMENVFFKLHRKLITRITPYFPLWFLRVAEMVAFLNAMACFALLLYLHCSFVSNTSNCVAQSLREQLAEHAAKNGGDDADLVRISVGGIWSHLATVDSAGAAAVAQARGGVGAIGNAGSDLLETWLSDPVFLYSRERGFLLLDEILRAKHGISQLNVTLGLECLGEQTAPVIAYMLDNFVGYQTVVLNTLIHATDGVGFMFAFQSRDLVDLGYASSGCSSGSGLNSTIDPASDYMTASHFNARIASVLVTKLGIAATTLFLFFITTTLVHHVLRESQGIVLQFTFDLQTLIEASQPTHTLVSNHVLNSFVFVPIMVGMLFFLFEFYNDQLLAFMLLAIVWIGELFSSITMRTLPTIQWFPKLFCAYFCSFHIYIFSCASGFSYLALTTLVIFLHHAMLRFWCRYEIPAFLQGEVTAEKPRQVTFTFHNPGALGACGLGLPPSLAYHTLLGSLLYTRSNDPTAKAVEIPAATVVSQQRDEQTPASTTTQSLKAKEITSSPQSEPTFFVGEEEEQHDVPVNTRRKKRITLHNSPTLGMDAVDLRWRFTPGTGTAGFNDTSRQYQTRFLPGGTVHS